MIAETPRWASSSISSTTTKLIAAAVFFTLLIAGYLSPRTIHASTPAQAVEAKNPLPATEKNMALGVDHFDAHCASCHAATGKGDTEKGKAVRAADLTSPDVQSKSDKELFDIIAKGVPGTAMPGFGKTHSPTEIWHTVLFLRKLPTLTPDERKKLVAAVPPEARHHPQAQMPPEHHHDAPPPAPPPPQDRSKMEHPHTEQPGEMKHDMPGHDMAKMNDAPAGQDMNTMTGAHDMHALMTTITGGPFKAMQAIGSGTSLMPATSPMNMWHWMVGNWMIMSHANVIVDFNHQGGP